MNTGTIWDAIIEHGIATEEEMELVTTINGYNEDALNDVIYVRTGYRNIEQLLEDWKGRRDHSKSYIQRKTIYW